MPVDGAIQFALRKEVLSKNSWGHQSNTKEEPSIELNIPIAVVHGDLNVMDHNARNGSENAIAPQTELLAGEAHRTLSVVESVVDDETAENGVGILPEDFLAETNAGLVLATIDVSFTHGEGHFAFIATVFAVADILVKVTLAEHEPNSHRNVV